MRFWDSSALVALVVEEAQSGSARALLRADPTVAVWALTRTEIVSALRRKQREERLSRHDIQAALERLDWLEEDWIEVDALAPIRERAERLLAAHPLRAADALQLAAALCLSEERPRGWEVVTSDHRLADAAAAEGFTVQGATPER